MANYVAQLCGCTLTGVYGGHKRPKTCELHGNLFEKVREDGSKVSRRPNQPDRDWTDAQAKVEKEGCCRICKRTDRPLEACHVLGREHDEPKVSKATGEILKVLYVHPDRIFPGCGPYPEGCHGAQHNREINVLQHLTLEEQIQAVKDAGGIEAARIRLEPVNYNAEVVRAAA